jgi:RNA polymerase sigma-70 factor (ECF subfamily)
MNEVPEPDSSAYLLARWRAGDQEAAARLWHRYATRLVGLARKWLTAEMARQQDPEDVVQSAYRSFFAGARSDVFVLRHSGDLWRLLVKITRNKLRDRFKRQRRLKRGGGHDGTEPAPREAEPVCPRPTPADAAALADEIRLVLAPLGPGQRCMVELRLQGYTLEEVAAATGHNERTVRRVLQRVEEHLRRRCRDGMGS